jgi:hypothetical protein
MNVLSRLFAFCAIGTIIVVGMIGNMGDWSFWLILKGTLVASAFAALSAWANSVSSREPQKPVDTRAQDIWRDVQQGKRPRFHLYLRPFDITNKVRVPNRRRSPDLFNPVHYEELRTTDFESILEDASPLPLIALGRPGEAVGAGRISTTEETWWDVFLSLAKSAEKLFVVPSDKSGTKREIEWLKASGNLKKCIFLCPPGRVNVQSDSNPDWDKAASGLGIQLATYSSLGKLFRVDDLGQLTREVTFSSSNRSSVSGAISSLEGKVEPVAAPAEPDKTSLPSLANYEQASAMNGLLKFVLIVLAAMVAGFVIQILKS